MKAPMCSADNCNVLIDLAPLCEVCVSILSWCIIFFSHSVSVWLNVAYGQNCLHTLTDDFELLEMQKIWQGFIPSTVGSHFRFHLFGRAMKLVLKSCQRGHYSVSICAKFLQN